MLVAQCIVLSPDAQTHETFRCSHTQIIGADEDSDRKTRYACGPKSMTSKGVKGLLFLDYLL